MTIYLYVKTHNKTGLKYLGKTESKDPHKYPGSGKYWQHHLKTHGKDYSTEIIKECESMEEFSKWGLYYSNLWNVVESDDWANLTEETGDARGLRRYNGYWRGKTRSDIDKEKISQGRKGKGKGHNRTLTEESKEKIRAARKLQIITEEHKKKIGDGNRGKPKPVLQCPHCGKEGGAPQMKRWHFDNCKSK